MKVIIEGQTKEINLRTFKRILKKLEGEDITIWWKYYIGCYDAPVKYKLKKVGKKIIVKCIQNRRSWDLEVPTKEFIENVDYWYLSDKELKETLGKLS